MTTQKTAEAIAEQMFGPHVCEVCGARAIGYSNVYQEDSPGSIDDVEFVTVRRLSGPHWHCKVHRRESVWYDCDGNLREQDEADA